MTIMPRIGASLKICLRLKLVAAISSPATHPLMTGVNEQTPLSENYSKLVEPASGRFEGSARIPGIRELGAA